MNPTSISFAWNVHLRQYKIHWLKLAINKTPLTPPIYLGVNEPLENNPGIQLRYRAGRKHELVLGHVI